MSRYSIRIGLLFSSLAMIVALSATASAQTKLEWKFKKGQHYRQEVEQIMDMTMVVQEQKVTTSMNQKIDTDWIVESVDDAGTAKIKQEITRLRMSMTSPGLNFEFDSKDEEKELDGIGKILAPALKGLAKAKFTVTMNRLGTIEDVEISEETLKGFQAVPGAGQMGGMFSKEGLVNLVKQSGTDFPKDGVENGKSWKKSNEVKLPQVGKMKSDGTMTYAGSTKIDGRMLERIDVDLALDLVPSDNAQAKVELKDQSVQGKLLFDNETGWLHASEMKQVMTMQITAGPAVIDQVLDQQIKAKMVPVEGDE